MIDPGAAALCISAVGLLGSCCAIGPVATALDLLLDDLQHANHPNPPPPRVDEQTARRLEREKLALFTGEYAYP